MKRFFPSLLFSVFIVLSTFSANNPEENIRVGISFAPPFVIIDSVAKSGAFFRIYR